MNITVRAKEIKIKNPLMVIEDENRAEVVEFAIVQASAIQGLSGMAFYAQFRNKAGEIGMDATTKRYSESDDTLYLDWLPSATFTKEGGVTEIQIVGFTQSLVATEDETYQEGKFYFTSTGDFIPVYPATSEHSPKVGDEITGTIYENQITSDDHRWSTAKAVLMLPENITDEGTPVYTKEQVQSLITQLNEQVLLAKGYSESAASSASTATTKANLAADWAEKEAAVTTGHYSAKHWADIASQAGTGIEANALKAEGYAVGEQNGEPVSEGTYYHNNAKYFSEQASGSATTAGNAATTAEGYKTTAGQYADAAGTAKTGAETAEGKAEKWATEAEDTPVETSPNKYSALHYAAKASASATSASGSADAADASADLAEAWAESDDAIGTSSHSAKWWAEKAEDEAADNVKHDDDATLISATTPINADQLNGHTDAYFAVNASSGSTLEMSINTTDYIITALLKNAAGTTISTATIDLPSEHAVSGIEYLPDAQALRFTFQGGTFIDVSLSALISELVTYTTFTAHATNSTIHITASERAAWNAHAADTTIHTSSTEKGVWNSHVADTDIHVTGTEHSSYNSHLANDVIHVTAQEHQDYNTHIADGDIHVTASQKTAWTAKYDKPQGGIPKTDLANTVQTSLSYADNSITYTDTVIA